MIRAEYTKTPIPVSFTSSNFRIRKRVWKEKDFYPLPRGRLSAKVLVFHEPKDLHWFWKDILGRFDLGKGCLAAVHALSIHGERYHKPTDSFIPFFRVDPRYFCLVGLLKNHLTLEILAHESVHVGYAYSKRIRRNMFTRKGDLDEEEVAYPAGRFTAAIYHDLVRK